MVDLCVVSYNTQEKLKRFLDVLHEEEGGDHWNLYILDNHSTDGTQKWLKENAKDYNITKVFYSRTNTGYSDACNKLASISKGEVLGLLNADVWMTTSDVKAIQDAFNADPRIAVLGPKQRNEVGYITHAGVFGNLVQPRHRGWHEYDPADTAFRDRLDAVTVSGSAYFVRRTAWEELTKCPIYRAAFPEAKGAFLPTPHYYEETWCSYHARAHGLSVVYDGTISIGHSWHSSSDVGGEADKMFSYSKLMFQQMCDMHNIAHD